MNKIMAFSIFCMFFSIQPVFGDSFRHHDDSGMSRYEKMKIRDRTERGYTNKGRVVYEYVDDRNLHEYDPHRIGVVDLDRNSRAREVYVVVDIDQPIDFGRNEGAEGIEIGIVNAHGRNADNLRNVEISVELDKRVQY